MAQPAPVNLLQEITFAIDDVEGLKKYLSVKHVTFKELKTPWESSLALVDPEGHSISFVKPHPDITLSGQANRLIHTGFVVKDRTAMDHFYKDILGFHLYWQGGMKDGETDWVDMQVPDGTDWIEYMLNVPENADKHLLGVMNHIALGVRDVRVADNLLLESPMKMNITETPQIGRDGKWQLNLYDPDGTRVELMEYTPVQKPCCSQFAGPHPKP